MEGGDFRVSSIDQRVVQMKFDNAQFEQASATSLATLAKLNKSLQLTGATKGLGDVGSAADRVSFKGLTAGLETLSSKFNTMSLIGITALTNVTNKAVDAGIRMTKAFTIDPVKAGFENYETQINAVQTILANTVAAGTKLPEVNKALAELNTYANQTVYNFSDMTKNIGTFTAAGVGLQTSVNSIKGIANLAAMSGSTSEQASTAMYQLSQAIASGSVKLQDWNSVVNAGLGGKTFQTALENTARAAGVNIDAIIKKAGSFRESLQEGWLTSDVLTKTLSQFTGDLSAAQIKAMGFTDAQAKQIAAVGKTAVDAATKIKTGTQLAQALKEEVASAYGAVFKTIFGDINQATDFFTALHNVAENSLTGPVYALNSLLEGWAKLGGRTVAIEGLKAAFNDLHAILKPVGDAFREIFPATTSKRLYDATVTFRDFFERLKIGEDASNKLKRTFAGLFAAIGIIFDIVKAVGREFGILFGIVGKNSGGFLDLTARVGDFVVRLKAALERGDAFSKAFDKVNAAVVSVVNLIKSYAQYVEGFFSKGIDTSKFDDVTKAFDGVKKNIGPIGQLSGLANKAWAELFSHLDKVANVIDPIAKKFAQFFINLGKSIANSAGSIDFSSILAVFNTGLFAGLLLLVKKFVDKFKSGGGGGLGSLVSTIKESFEGLTKTLETMQGTLKAATLLEIAAAIGILTISVSTLSTIDAAGLTRSSIALTIMFTQLVASLGIFQKFVGTAGFAKLPFTMISLILLAGAIDVLVVSVKKLSEMDWKSLAKGLTGVSVLLTVLAADVKLMGNPEHMISVGLGLTALAKGIKVLSDVVITMSGLSWTDMAKGLIGVGAMLFSLALFSKFAEADVAGASQGLGIILLATGIKILASATADFGKMSWTEIAKGLLGTAGGLAAIAGALALIPPGSVFNAVGVLLVAASLSLIGDAIKKMGDLTKKEIAKGLIAIAGGLTLIAGALYLLPPQSLLSAAAIFITAASLEIIGDALGKMGGMSWESISKGLIELAGALGIIAVGLTLMIGTLPGSAAMLVMAGALAILTPVLMAFGNMSWESILKSIVELAGIFLVLALAGVALAPVTPVLLALGGAVILLGLGVLATGAGLLLFSAGLTALSIAGAAGTAALVALVTAMLGLLPLVATEIGLAIIAFAKVIATAGPAITGALVAVLGAILDAFKKLTPKIVDTFLNMLLTLLDKAVEYAPKMLASGIDLIVKLLEGIAQKLPDIIKAAVDVMVAFMKGIGDQLPKLIQAGFDLMLKFINGLADAIVKNAPAVGAAAVHLAESIIEGIVRGIAAGAGKVWDAIGNVATGALKHAMGILDIGSPSKKFKKIGMWTTEGFALGIIANANMVDEATAKISKGSLAVMKNAVKNLAYIVPDNININPVISPVLDLSNVEKSSSKLGDMLTPPPLDVAATSYTAAKISGGYSQRNISETIKTDTNAVGNDKAPIVYNQYNTSPKALSPAEIYRQTKNQLSSVRGVYVYQNGGGG
jgi:tape measure domain-containing protein